MLKKIPKVLPPELVKLMMEMGHGDELVIGDANFPAASCCKNVVRMDGIGAPEILEAILQLFPLDPYVKCPVMLMEVVPGDTVQTPIWDVYGEIVEKHDPRGKNAFDKIERFAFYDRVKANAFVAVQSGESALYANIILKKGVI